MQAPLPIRSQPRQHARNHRRCAFTLIELMIVITIILILTAVTVASFNYSIDADRVRSAARQFQSFLAGARDKAIYAKDIRGVRLLVDPNDKHTVSAMQYIGSPQQETSGFVIPSDWNVASTTGSTTGYYVMLGTSTTTVNRWKLLVNRGFFRPGCRIQIPKATSGNWYTVTAISFDPASSPANNPILILDSAVPLLGGVPLSNPPPATPSVASSYVLELSPGILGDAQPVPFPRGVVIDLDGSKLPTSWYPTSFGGAYGSQTQLDILFTPRGTVVGDAFAAGVLHFHFADVGDVTKWHVNSLLNGRNTANYNTSTYPLPVVPANNLNALPPLVAVTKDRILASLAARTGNVGVYYVNEFVPASNTTTPIASDPYSFAESGRVANK